jgi:translation initiation factor IF-3
MNRQIRAPQVRLIDHDGTQVGVTPLEEALRLAQERGHDLVEVAAQADPPVCKIVNFSKYRYEREKQRKEAKKHQKGGHVKEVRFRTRIGAHDLATKIRAIKSFLEGRDKVRISVQFRGREMEHKDIGRKLIDRVMEMVGEMAVPESSPSMLGKYMILMLAPNKIGKPNAQTQVP